MKRLNRLIGVLLALTVLITAVSVGASVYFAHQSKETTMLEQLDTDVHTLYDTQENMETALETLSACFSNAQDLTQDTVIATMNALKEEYHFSFVARTGADGYAVNNEGKADIFLGERDYFKAGMAGKTTTSFISQGLVDSTSGYLLTAVPVYKEHRPNGIVHGSYSTASYLSQVMKTTGDDTLILLLDADGNILGSNGEQEVSGNVEAYLDKQKDRNAFFQNLMAGKTASVDLRLNGVHTCATYAPLQFANSRLFVMFATPTKSIPFSSEGFWHAAGVMLSANSILVALLLLSIFALWRFKLQLMKSELEKQHMESISAERQMYHSIIDETASAIIVIDVKTHEVLYANSVALNLLADRPEEFIGTPCYKSIVHRDTPCEFCPIKNGAVVPESREFDIAGRKYLQEFKPILWQGRDALVEYNRDITQVNQLIDELREQKENYRDVYNSLPSGVVEYIFKDGKIRYTDCNELMLKMLGYSREELLSEEWHGFDSFSHEESFDRFVQVFGSLHQVGDVRPFEFRLRRKDGDYKWVSGTLLVRAIDAEGYHILSAVNDEDARKKAESESSAKSRFLSRMSHEIRTPINAIMGIAELERQDVEEGKICESNVAKYAKETVTASEYLLTLVNDILDTSRIENNSIEIKAETINAAAYLEGVGKLVESLSVGTDIHFTMERKTHLRDSYIGDGVRVKQVVMNLLSNAFKFTPAGGSVKLTAEAISETKENTVLQFTVEDTGIGIGPEFQKKLFTAFAQENSDTTSPYSGSGLGLSIARELTRRMGGDLVCRSEKGKGSTFIATVTVGNPQEGDREPEPVNSVEKLDFTGLRILVCEDHPLNQKITKALLERKHCAVEIAADGAIGLKMFANSPVGYYSMVLMDIRMPHMDGLQTTRSIRSLPRADAATVPIVAMSANAFDEDIRKSLSAGMNEHLAKPVDATKLYHAVAAYTHLLVEAAEGKPTVLVVDDVAVNRAVICEALRHDYAVLTAENGHAAMGLLEHNPGIVAVVTDIQMPEMDGIQLVKTIRSEYRFEDVAILANTQFGDGSQEQLLLSMGADDFVYKPTEPAVLVARLKNALARRKHIL